MTSVQICEPLTEPFLSYFRRRVSAGMSECADALDLAAVTVGNRYLESESRVISFKQAFPVAKEIVTLFRNTEFDEEADMEMTKQAVEEAADFAFRYFREGPARSTVGEDGSVSIKLVREKLAVLMVFIGDGTVAYSVPEDGNGYAASIREVRLSDPLPQNLKEAIGKVVHTPDVR